MDGKQLVILVHGIKDSARWQIDVGNALRSETKGIEVWAVNYGRWGAWYLWCPVFTRRLAFNKFSALINPAFAYAQKNNMKVSIIAHSWGTYMTSEYLYKDEQAIVDKWVLCGCILSRYYPRPIAPLK